MSNSPIPPFSSSWRVQGLAASAWALIAVGAIALNPFGNIAGAAIAAAVAVGFAAASGPLARNGRRRERQLRESGPEAERIP